MIEYRVVDRRKNITPDHKMSEILVSIERQPYEIQRKDSIVDKFLTIPGMYYGTLDEAKKVIKKLRKEQQCSPEKS